MGSLSRENPLPETAENSFTNGITLIKNDHSKATEETSCYIPTSESLHSVHQNPSKLGEDHDGATAEWLQMQTVVHKESEQTLFRREIEDSEGHLDLEAGQHTENVQAHPDEDNVVANVEENKYLQGYELVTVVICVIIVYFLTYLNGAGMIATALPAITAEFNSLADIGWYGSAYFSEFFLCQALSSFQNMYLACLSFQIVTHEMDKLRAGKHSCQQSCGPTHNPVPKSCLVL